MQAAPPHVDRLDPLGPTFLDGQHMAVDEHLIILDQAAEWAERQHDGRQRGIVRAADVEDKAAFLDGEMERVGAGLSPACQASSRG